jgi:hypothetical protein
VLGFLCFLLKNSAQLHTNPINHKQGTSATTNSEQWQNQRHIPEDVIVVPILSQLTSPHLSKIHPAKVRELDFSYNSVSVKVDYDGFGNF